MIYHETDDGRRLTNDDGYTTHVTPTIPATTVFTTESYATISREKPTPPNEMLYCVA